MFTSRWYRDEQPQRCRDFPVVQGASFCGSHDSWRSPGWWLSGSVYGAVERSKCPALEEGKTRHCYSCVFYHLFHSLFLSVTIFPIWRCRSLPDQQRGAVLITSQLTWCHSDSWLNMPKAIRYDWAFRWKKKLYAVFVIIQLSYEPVSHLVIGSQMRLSKKLCY
jgi:hypothetical protein